MILNYEFKFRYNVMEESLRNRNNKLIFILFVQQFSLYFY